MDEFNKSTFIEEENFDNNNIVDKERYDVRKEKYLRRLIMKKYYDDDIAAESIKAQMKEEGMEYREDAVDDFVNKGKIRNHKFQVSCKIIKVLLALSIWILFKPSSGIQGACIFMVSSIMIFFTNSKIKHKYDAFIVKKIKLKCYLGVLYGSITTFIVLFIILFFYYYGF